MIFALILSCLFGFFIRLSDLPLLMGGGYNRVPGIDPWYTIRQVELLLTHFPVYSWFDPMTGFPFGKIVDWGPLFPFVCSIILLPVGLDNPESFYHIAGIIPPLLAIAMVPVVFLLGTCLFDKNSGFFAALLLPLLSGWFMFNSLYGYLDHHIAEALFFALFCCTYCYGLQNARSTDPVMSRSTLHQIIIPGLLSGLFYFCCIEIVPSMVLLSLVILIFLFLHVLIYPGDTFRFGKIVALNTVLYGSFILLYLVFGLRDYSLQLIQYSFGQIILAGCVCLSGLFFYGFCRFFSRLQQWQTSFLLLMIATAGGLVVLLGIPALSIRIIQGFQAFFLLSSDETFIREMEAQTLATIWDHYSLVLLLVVIGLLILINRLILEKRSEHLFLLATFGFLGFSSILHQKYEYLLAIPVVLLAGLSCSAYLTWVSGRSEGIRLWNGISLPVLSDIAESWKKMVQSHPMGRYCVLLILFLVVGLSSTMSTQSFVHDQLTVFSDDWMEAMDYLSQQTPSPGVDPLGFYDAEVVHYPNGTYGILFPYPPGSYGVLTWWDYGHLVSVAGQRPAILNPFQDNMRNLFNPELNILPNAASFFVDTNESRAYETAMRYGARYIITDDAMAWGFFPAMVSWAGPPYSLDQFLRVENRSPLFKEPYYLSMVTRLHLFDGSETKSMNAASSDRQKSGILSKNPGMPTVDIPALDNYRLVFESSSPSSLSDSSHGGQVKIFERVPGNQIDGSGTISIRLKTNQERMFTYSQESVNGSFRVPYQIGKNGAVETVGKYMIDGKEVDLPR